MRFTKMQAAGNDYVYMDTLKAPISSPEALARRISDRHFGVGSDGLILICPPSDPGAADFRMRMFNADGLGGRDVWQRHPLRRQVRLRQRAYG